MAMVLIRRSDGKDAVKRFGGSSLSMGFWGIKRLSLTQLEFRLFRFRFAFFDTAVRW
jgi:hypothetical protein